MEVGLVGGLVLLGGAALGRGEGEGQAPGTAGHGGHGALRCGVPGAAAGRLHGAGAQQRVGVQVRHDPA